MSSSTPESPRQREILRRLKLVGGAPASYFLDACRLMAQDPALDSQTHLVGHLLRELNGGLVEALRPMVPIESWPGNGVTDSQSKRVAAICDALRVPADDSLRKSWKAFSSRLAKLAHRRGLIAPRPCDRDFEEHWELGEAVLHALTQRIEANYAENLPRIEQLAGEAPNIKAYRGTMLHSTVALDRFYAIAGVEWLEPLRGEGAFDNPPPLVPNEEGMYAYPRWPQGRFLARVGSAAPQTVIEIGKGLQTDNPEAQESLVSAACDMEIGDAVELVEPIERWLATPMQWSLPYKARDLIVRLVEGGAVDQGLVLTRALVTSLEARRGSGVAGEHVSWLTERVFPAVGISGLQLLADLLTEEANRDGSRGLEYSQIWRPDIGSERMRDDRDQVVSAVRDAAASLAAAEHDLADITAVLEQVELQITRRVAIDLLRRYPGADPARAYLLDREILEDDSYRREYVMLAEVAFGSLPRESQAELLGWVEEARHLAEHPERQCVWRLQMLNAFGSQLPREWAARRAELESEIGPIEPGNFVLPQARVIGSRPPITPEELKEMEIDALIDYLRAWMPEDDLESPGRDALARALEGVVRDEPALYADSALAFVEVDPTYVRGLLGGLDGALKAQNSFAWRRVLDLIAAISNRIGEDDEWQGLGPSDRDPGWSWSWIQALDLIIHGLNSAENEIPGDLLDAVAGIVRAHVARPEPAIAVEREDEREPESLALNSVRCTALRATIILAARKHDVDSDAGFDPDVAALLEGLLDPEKEPSGAVRSILGWYFPTLMVCDEAWALGHVGEIFPSEGQDRLWRASWESFVMRNHGHPKLLQALEASYRRAVAEISPEKPAERLNDPDEALVAHLISYYLSGTIDFGDAGLIDYFYDQASVERRSEAISILGTSMEALSPLREETEVRLRSLAERRLEAIRGEGDDAEELSGFAWWFSSGEFDTDWSLDYLRRLLEAGSRPHPDHMVAERLAEMAGSNAVERIKILRLMVERGARDWFVLGSREAIEALLREGLAAGGEAGSRARDLINIVVARGNLDFADLLGGEGSGAEG